MESSMLKGTLGKMICKVQVTDTYGEVLSRKSSLIRNLCKLINVFLLFTKENGIFLHERKSSSMVIGRI